MAVSLFVQARQPGIYKQDYLDELYDRYADVEAVPKLMAPPYPQWDNDSNIDNIHADDSDLDEQNFSSKCITREKRGSKRPRTEETKLNAQFAEPDLDGIELCRDADEISKIRREMQNMCSWNG